MRISTSSGLSNLLRILENPAPNFGPKLWSSFTKFLLCFWVGRDLKPPPCPIEWDFLCPSPPMCWLQEIQILLPFVKRGYLAKASSYIIDELGFDTFPLISLSSIESIFFLSAFCSLLWSILSILLFKSVNTFSSTFCLNFSKKS